MLKTKALIPLVLTIAACTGERPPSVPLRTGTPESVGFSTERLRRVDAALNRWIEEGRIPGAVGLVIRKGTIVYYRAAGFDDPDTKEPLATDDIFRIASQSKAITSVAAMMLYEEGKFLLDDAVSKFIPAFATQKVLQNFRESDTSYTTVPLERPVTVRHLLTHTAGLGYPAFGLSAGTIYTKRGFPAALTWGFDERGERLADVVTRLADVPLLHQPGEQWTYGFGVDVLGRLVEVWSGMPLDEFFRQRIFDPLGMDDTYFNVPSTKADRLVNFFQVDSLGRHTKQSALTFPHGFAPLPMDYPLRDHTYFSGGGGLSSTILDYGVFLQMLLNGGEYDGTRLLSRNTIRMMTMNQIGDLNARQDKFGLGFSIVTEEGSSRYPSRAGTYWWGGALSTRYWVDPVEELIVVLYRQMWGGPATDVDDTFRVLVYQALVDDGR